MTKEERIKTLEEIIDRLINLQTDIADAGEIQFVRNAQNKIAIMDSHIYSDYHLAALQEREEFINTITSNYWKEKLSLV
jgi:hypothetical protein